MNDHIAWMRDVAQAYTELASEAVHYAKLSAVRSWYRARAGTARSYARAAHSTDEIVSRTRDKARFMQREQPVRVLAIVAGAAVVAGIATRIWRSQSYES